MKQLFTSVFVFFNKHYILFLLLVVFVSYGQLLWMVPWQDDNALFFKLIHIDQNAGYLPAGPFGLGPYKYIQTPYIPIVSLFGLAPLPYYLMAIVFYFLATLVVYKVLSKMLGEAGGRVSGFLFAVGYIASDGFIRLFNTINTSVSIALLALLSYCYWKFIHSNSKTKFRGITDSLLRGRYKWYLIAVFLYFLSIEFARLRAHYFIAIIFSFEIIYLTFEKRFKSFIASIFRLLPFIFLFYRYYVVNADHRSGKVGDFLVAILNGEYYQTYGWLSSLSNLVIPDWIPSYLFQPALRSSLLFEITSLFLPFLVALIVAIRLIKKKIKLKRVHAIVVMMVISVFFWFTYSQSIFSVPVLNLQQISKFKAFLGGIILLSGGVLYFYLEREKRKLFLLFFIWMIANIGAYAAYQPTVSYETVNRLLAHSLFPLVGIFGLLYVVLQKKGGLQSVLISNGILLLGISNLVGALLYQRSILETRSLPVIKFYQQLKEYVPNSTKGDIFYFDVADDARSYFNHAFSVASMPETTALAWRYDLDRYDIRRVTDFEELLTLLDDGAFGDINDDTTPINDTYTFFYSANGLINTSEKVQEYLYADKKAVGTKTLFETKILASETIVDFLSPMDSVTPIMFELKLAASMDDLNEIEFPYVSNRLMINNSVANDESLRNLAFEYRNSKKRTLDILEADTSSDWRGNEGSYLSDGNSQTVWQSDRVLWGQKGDPAVVTLDMGERQTVDRLIWINGFSHNTPTEYEVLVSDGGLEWTRVASISQDDRFEPTQLQTIRFDAVNTRYVRFHISKSLGGDSPRIAELWIVPAKFSDLDIVDTEEFLEMPFGYVPDKSSFNNTLKNLRSIGEVEIYWKNDKSTNWITENKARRLAVYDGKSRSYSLIIPAGGTMIKQLRLLGNQIPGTIRLDNVSVSYPTLKDLIE